MAPKLPLPRGWNRRVRSAVPHTLAGAGLSPAGTTDLFTAHLDQYTHMGSGDRVVLVMGYPPGRMGRTDLVKLHEVGDVTR